MTESTKKSIFHCKSVYVDLTAHAVLTLVLAYFFYVTTGSMIWSFLCVVGGIMIDVDHLVDHFCYFGPRFKIKDFMLQKSLQSGKAYVPFHSWELASLLWLSSFWVSWAIPLAVGVTGHLVIDQIGLRGDPFFYFLMYRWRCQFRCVRCKDNGGENGIKKH